MMLRYVIAFLLTILLLAVARRTSTRHPEEFQVKANGITLVHRSVTESFGETPVIRLQASSTSTVRAIVNYSETKSGPYRKMEMAVTGHGYVTDLPALEKGKKWFYHIDVMQDNMKIAQLPPANDQFIKFKGHVSPAILIPHIICMFATIFFGILTVFTAIDFARGKGEIQRTVRFLLITVIFAFLGGFPLGYAVAYQAFGQGWSGIPIGWDITDNKTVILFLFWLVTFILAAQGLSARAIKISPKSYASLVAVSFVITLITFLIPHSI
ncbi:MAG: hypothetical protein A2W25_06540 [candidate division Zixibacteria bacterium RBG_16_53_22]|nr:MAG: hypothetical protein A2W25_06540 [candidate division Zixibacteria bacterium RBG_16_53_22]